MSAGGDTGQKGPAVSAQESQMQAIMQQARVTHQALTVLYWTDSLAVEMCLLLF